MCHNFECVIKKSNAIVPGPLKFFWQRLSYETTIEYCSRWGNETCIQAATSSASVKAVKSFSIYEHP